MRKNYKNYTRYVKQKLQSYFDISTSTDGQQVLQFNCGGNDLIARMPGMFGSFKYFRLGRLKVTAVPASTLPVDPTGLSYEAGENTVDPRDQLTPGLIRITNGEDLRSFSETEAISDAEYNAMMLDPRWFKFMLQTGFKRSCSPKFWGVGILQQMEYPGSLLNFGINSLNSLSQLSIGSRSLVYKTDDGLGTNGQWSEWGPSDPRSFFQTGQKIRMGWLPTDYIHEAFDSDFELGAVKAVPECQCITVILPKQRKTRYYYRVFVTETVYFKDPVVRAPYGANLNVNPIDYQPQEIHLQ